MTTENQTEERYDCVSIVKTVDPDPVNDVPEDFIWFVEGRHYDGDDYRVMTEDGGTLAISTETITVIELPIQLPTQEAIERAREQVKELVSVAGESDDAAESEVNPDR